MAGCRQLLMPRHRRSMFGRRAFSVAGPAAWNSLPDYLRDPSRYVDSFHRDLKTVLFSFYYRTQRIRGFAIMCYINLLLTLIWRPEVTRRCNFVKHFCIFLEKRPVTVKFSKFCSKRFHRLTIDIVVFKFHEIWLTGNWRNHALFTRQKKIRLPFKFSLLRGSCPKSARANPQQCAQRASDIIPIGSLSA